MLPIDIAIQMGEAVEDKEITTSEVQSMMMTVFNTALGGIVIAFGMSMFIKATGGKPAFVKEIQQVQAVESLAGAVEEL